MLAQFAADLTVLVHLLFILFVVFGGVLVLHSRGLLWAHLPAICWAVLIEFAGWICPLTPLENVFRQMAGAQGYAESFIGHYLLPIIYPAELTRELQIIFGWGVILVNLLIYGVVLMRWKRRP